jgi:N-glycosylase/DNA lyase
VAAPPDRSPQFAFPRPEVLAALPESELRACKMGFRARYLLHAAQQVASGQLDLAGLFALPMDEARAALMRVDGVGPKIADCVLLFALGFDRAFPVDVWIARVLREQYFPRRRPSPQRLAKFIANHFGPHAGYAQQYLFHYFRVVERK